MYVRTGWQRKEKNERIKNAKKKKIMFQQFIICERGLRCVRVWTHIAVIVFVTYGSNFITRAILIGYRRLRITYSGLKRNGGKFQAIRYESNFTRSNCSEIRLFDGIKIVAKNKEK